MSKRASTELGSTSQSKKSKVTDASNTYLHVSFRESGLILKHPPEKCTASHETIQIIRNLKKNLEKHFDYPRNLTDLFKNYEDECNDLEIFKHYLFPNILRISDSAEEYPVNDSVIKILLSVPVIQSKISDHIFEKAIDLAAESMCGPWIQMILKCFSSLDSIVSTDKISTNLINLLDVASEKMVKMEIITALPDIIGDQEHDNVATELSRILSEDHDLIPAILDCLSYLCLSDDQYVQLQKKSLNLLARLTRYNYFPNFIKFLLMPGRMNDASYLEAVQGLRNSLGWSDNNIRSPEIATSQVLTATAIRNSMVSSKVICNSWLKAVSLCKESTSYKPIDFVVLLIAYSVSEEKQKQVENLIRKQIKLNILKLDLLDRAFMKFKPILGEYLKFLIDVSNSLLKIKTDPAVEVFAADMYYLILMKIDDSQTIVAGLLQLGLDSKHCVMSTLNILNRTVHRDHINLVKPQSVQMLTLLDRMDNMSLDEVRAVMNLLCALAYYPRQSDIRDDLHMIIRKELGSSNPKIKVQGILAGVYAVKYLMMDDTAIYMEFPNGYLGHPVTYTHPTEENIRDAGQIIELISRSTRQWPDMIAFFYDELSKIILPVTRPYSEKFLSWLTDAVTNDLQQNFIVETIEVDTINDLKLTMQYCLNTEGEIDEMIAINIAGLTLDSKSEVHIGILSPLFQLVQTLHYKQHDGNLSSIDALLGCPIVMPKFDIDLIEDMDSVAISSILDCLVHCMNWFIELINAFATQNDEHLNTKILKRIFHIEELEKNVQEILIRSKIAYKPPLCTFNVNKYTGEQPEIKSIKAQTSKQKGSTKKSGQDDSVLPQTVKSQATQNNASVKNSLELSHNMPIRQLNLSIINLIKIEMTDDKELTTELTVNTLIFLLKNINSNIEKVLLSKTKRKTFLSKQNSVEYDAQKASECAKIVNGVIPQLVQHLKFVTLSMEKCIGAQVENEVDITSTPDLFNLITCLECIFNFCTIYFKWMGFKQVENGALLKSSLQSVADISDDEGIMTLRVILLKVAQKLEKYEKYCFQISTAISLIEFLKSIQLYSDGLVISSILKTLAQNFLSRQWKTPEGTLEKGLLYNQGIDLLSSIYFINNEVVALKNLALQLTEDIKLLKNNKNTLSTFKGINKSNFPILYRNLGSALHDATKACLEKGMTNSEHLNLWKEVATIMKHMSEIAKVLENRNNLTAFFKKSIPVLKLFMSQGIPILEIQFKSKNQECLEILKILQQSTRFLQTLCCHSRLKKDTVLMSKVPHMRQLLETLIYKVKAVLAANNCSEAFWMGNLKNKDIHGEVIASQQSIESEESVEDCDEQLPEDEDSDDTDDDMLNPDSRSLSDIV